MANTISWYEIPVTDMERAVKFYSEVLGSEMNQMEFVGVKMALIPMDGEGIGGALCQGAGYKPTTEGTLVYLNGGDDLNKPLSKVAEAGGKVLLEKTKINDEIGYMAMVMDTEGNRVAFHSKG